MTYPIGQSLTLTFLPLALGLPGRVQNPLFTFMNCQTSVKLGKYQGYLGKAHSLETLL